MAVFDLEEQKIYVRIVYDGAQNAGKTTNLQRLCDVFTTKRRSELYTPEELGGRTLYFDWVQISTGLANGFPLVCQVVTVPGQVVLEARRRHLLRTADAIVYVSESTSGGIGRCRNALRLLIEESSSRPNPLPVVVQANKQDLPNAMSPAAVVEALGLPSGTVSVAATAAEGSGVLETFVSAVRAVVNDIQERTRADGFRMAVMPAESAHEVYLRMAQEELDEGWVEELLDEQWDTGSMRPPGRSEAPAPSMEGAPLDVVTPAPPPVTRGEERADAPAEPASELQPALSSERPDEPARSSPPDEPAPLVSGAWSVAERAPTPPSAADDDGRDTVRPPAGSAPQKPPAPLPTHDVPTGFIWPASTGREALRTLDRSGVIVRGDLVGKQGLSEGSGKSDTILCQAGDWCLKTSERRHYADAESARAALVRAAREKATLSELVPPETVLVVQPDEDGSFWLWTVAPWLVTLRARMGEAVAAADEEKLAGALSTFAKVAVDALLLASRSGIVLDVHPSNYGERDGSIYYLDDDLTVGGTFPALGYSLLRRVEEYAAWPVATEAYVTALERQIAQRVGPNDAEKLDLAALFEQVLVHTPVGLGARDRLVRVLAQPARARA